MITIWLLISIKLRNCFSHTLGTLFAFFSGIEQVVSAKLLGITFSHNLKFDEHVKNILIICLSVWRAKTFGLKNSILFSVPWLSRAFCMPYQLWAVSWLLTLLAKLMLICLKPSDGVIMAIWNRCLNFFMMRIWNCLEVLHSTRSIHHLLPS